jgi:hypothetical protein
MLCSSISCSTMLVKKLQFVFINLVVQAFVTKNTCTRRRVMFRAPLTNIDASVLRDVRDERLTSELRDVIQTGGEKADGN